MFSWLLIIITIFWVFDQLMPDWQPKKYVQLETNNYNLALENQFPPLCRLHNIPWARRADLTSAVLAPF